MKYSFTLLLTVLCLNLHAQLYSSMGSRSSSVANASLLLTDNVYASFTNQAGLASFDKFAACAFSHNKFLVKELATHGAAVIIPGGKNGAFSGSVLYHGYSYFNQTKVGIGYGKKLSDIISAGIQLDYISTSITEDYGSKSAFTFEMGFIAKITQSLTAGAHIFNPIRAKLADYNDEKIPAIGRFALSYKFNDKCTLLAQSDKDFDHDFSFKSGIEYQIAKPLCIRAGINSKPTLLAFGLGINLGDFVIDIATDYHQVLGYSPTVGICYKVK
ncbi:MAG TPA: hypothetical protein PKN75_12415 [Bacteroidia bacterium]|nr:hypothetical protein [Bacteroidia bacterium]